ncbi:MAG: hypothetical protein ACRD4Q_05715 [Candidatus Acidiferrales bacterium]
MKRMITVVVATILLGGSTGFGIYAYAAHPADAPACCQKHEACCPSSSCCSGGSHTATCPMHRHA